MYTTSQSSWRSSSIRRWMHTSRAARGCDLSTSAVNLIARRVPPIAECVDVCVRFRAGRRVRGLHAHQLHVLCMCCDTRRVHRACCQRVGSASESAAHLRSCAKHRTNTVGMERDSCGAYTNPIDAAGGPAARGTLTGRGSPRSSPS
jgi:hypothetical protein